jgi:hypothetical protein
VGRHSSPEQSPFLRSIAGWLLPWLLVAIVAGAAVWVALDALTQGPLEAEPPAAAPPSEEPSASPTTTPTPKSSPTPEPTRERRRREKRDEKEPAKRPTPRLITRGVTVQVLNATSSPGADAAMARRLRGLGFDVLVTGSASRPYRNTTVFWSYGSARPAALRLARRFGWVAAPRPANLSTSVALHVVVGRDEA